MFLREIFSSLFSFCHTADQEANVNKWHQWASEEPCKWKWHFPKALRSCQYKPFCVSPWTHQVVWKAQGSTSEEYLLPGTHSHGRRMTRANGENSLTLCVFSWFMEIFTETGLQGEPQTHDMSLGDTKMFKPRRYLPRDALVWDCCTQLCQARKYSPHCTDPSWSPALSECLPEFLMREREKR